MPDRLLPTKVVRNADKLFGQEGLIGADGAVCRARGFSWGPGEHGCMSEMRTLSLVKAGHHFCFRYESGQEVQVLDALIEMVHRKQLQFDWFDAAVLSHQLGRHLAKELQTYLPKKAA